MHVDVLIVNYLSGDLTLLAAAAVQAPGVHIFIADNSGELQGTETLNFATKVIHNRVNVYYAKANNDLYRLCNGEFVLLLNPDVVCCASDLIGLVHELQFSPDAWGATPRLTNVDGSDQNYYRRLPTLQSMIADRMPAARPLLRSAWRNHIYVDLDMSKPGQVQAPPGACLLLKRSTAGPTLFDERYPLFFNDADLARRLNGKGICLYVSSVRVTHLKGASLAEERKRRRYAIARSYDLSAVQYARENIRGWQAVWIICSVRRVIGWILGRWHGTVLG